MFLAEVGTTKFAYRVCLVWGVYLSVVSACDSCFVYFCCLTHGCCELLGGREFGMINKINILREFLHKYLPWDELKHVKWMNAKPNANEAYDPTPVEHIANVLTHGVWVIPSVLATLQLFLLSHSFAQILSALVYGGTLIFLFSVSTSFHCVFYCNKHRQLRHVLHRCDRAMIYIFIAGSYFPWLTILELPTHGWASSMKWCVWLLAVLGIAYQQTFHERFKWLETVFYLVMGVGPSLFIISEHEFLGLSELKVGGFLYVLGVLFFKSDGAIPCAHAIWHLFVAGAAGVHYYAILRYLYGSAVGFEMR